MSDIRWDVFISHASEDKMDVALPLSELLAVEGLKVWLDQGEILIGDSLRNKIDSGLAQSQFGIVILSHSFFSKDWTKSELDGLFAREIGEKKVILPVWHNISYEEIKEYSPILAGRMAANTEYGLKEVKEKLVIAIDKIGRKLPSGKPVYSGRLLKKQLMKFTEGSYLVSNCFSPFDRKPLINEKIGSLESRNNLWEKIKNVGADGRMCHVFDLFNEYNTYLEKQSMWLGFQSLRNRKS